MVYLWRDKAKPAVSKSFFKVTRKGRRYTDMKLIRKKMSPEAKAEIEIQKLSRGRLLHQVLGGPTPPELLDKNKRIIDVRRCKELAIIKKHGVVKKYAQPVLERIEYLKAELAASQSKLKELQSICKHRNVKPGRRCPDCNGMI